MIVGRIWSSLRAQFNKLANFFWQSDPIAQLQYEYDNLVDQLKDSRVGFDQYRALVERVALQVNQQRKHVAELEARIRRYLAVGDRETASQFALELQKAKVELVENEAQLSLHDKAYGNTLLKIQHANKNLTTLRDKIKKYDADLKMSRAEAELAKIISSIRVDVSTDMGQVEQVIQDEIDRNRAKVRVAADVSAAETEGIKREMAADQILADQALEEFERSSEAAPTTSQERAREKMREKA